MASSSAARGLPEPGDGGSSPDRMTIRYLDGSAAGSPLTDPLAAARRAEFRVVDRQVGPTVRILAALSTALDLTEGQIPGHAVRTCYLATRLADAIGLRVDEREHLFSAALLKDAGCSSNAAAITRLFGADDIALKTRQATTERGILAYAAFTIRSLPETEPLPLRIRRLIRIGLTGTREQHQIDPPQPPHRSTIPARR